MNAFADKSVGFVGLGAMGLPIALRMAHSLPNFAVHDRDLNRVAAFTADLPEAKSGLEQIQKSDVVILCLPSLAASQLVVESLLSRTPSTRTFVDLGANPPNGIEELSKFCRAHDSAYCDAPVFGTPNMAAVGDLYFLFSGPQDIGAEFQKLAHLLQYRARIVDGPPGTASTLKLLQNGLGTANLLAAAEAMRICESMGIDPSMFAGVVRECGGIGLSSVFDRFADDMAGRRDSGEGRLRIASKDAQSVSDLAAANGTPTPLLDVASQQFQRANNAGMGEQQFTAIIDSDK